MVLVLKEDGAPQVRPGSTLGAGENVTMDFG